MIKRKKHSLGKLRRRYHRFFFLLGFVAGGALGFNLRKILDASVDRLEKIKNRKKAKKEETSSK